MGTNERGSALLEALPTSLVLFAFVSGLMLSAYILFARTWIQFQSEQALYCAAQTDSTSTCRYQLQEKLAQFLPWGNVNVQIQGSDQKWIVDVVWTFQDFAFRMHKELSPNGLLNAKALPW